jgi:hypothetical protein
VTSATLSIHGTVQHAERADLITAQAGDEGRGLPVAPGGLTDQPPALATAAPCPNHFGVGSGFIDEDELSCVSQFDCGNAWPTRAI